jgi:hypothetical protein
MFKQKLIILFTLSGLFIPLFYAEAGTVLSSHKYAWSNNVGYINFEHVTVGDTALGGYAWSANKGFIRFNPAQGGVFNDGAGNLFGSAWGEQLGWIDFDNVHIDANGRFSGTATGVLVGTITFDCPNYCDVQTDWRQTSASPAILSGALPGGNAGGKLIPGAGITAVNENNAAAPDAPNQIPGETPVPAASLQGVSVARIGEGAEPISLQVSTETRALFDIVAEPIQSRVAPGELFPISVRLSNFGAARRIDVLIEYSILSAAGEKLYAISETVAVETTANFVKTIQIPLGMAPGIYIAQTSITYGGQLVPAVTQFNFTVEQKILGLFQSDLALWGSITVVVGVLMLALGRTLVRRRRSERFTPLDYSGIPRDTRIFYEIISDAVMQMRQRVGDEALLIAARIDGLKIDTETGRVLDLAGQPPKIIATLVSEYQKLLGKKVSFALRHEQTDL